MPTVNPVNNYLLSLPGGICLQNVKYPRGALNAVASGNQDVYTVPAGRRAIVLTSSLYNGSVSTSTLVQKWKISGTYYNTNFSAISLATVTYLGDTSDGGFIMEAGESISWNGTQSSLNAWVQLIEIDNTAPIKTVKTIGSLNGDQTVYTCPVGKKAVVLKANGQIEGANNAGCFISNDSGGSIISNLYFVASGGSKGVGNLYRGSLTTTTGTASRINAGVVLSAGDFVVWNCNTTNANALCALTVMEI